MKGTVSKCVGLTVWVFNSLNMGRIRALWYEGLMLLKSTSYLPDCISRENFSAWKIPATYSPKDDKFTCSSFKFIYMKNYNLLFIKAFRASWLGGQSPGFFSRNTYTQGHFAVPFPRGAAHSFPSSLEEGQGQSHRGLGRHQCWQQPWRGTCTSEVSVAGLQQYVLQSR